MDLGFFFAYPLHAKQSAALGESVNNSVLDVAAHADKLYVAGEFNQAGGKEANHVAMWSMGK